MLIYNMGVPRSGTVWAFNVIRHVLDVAALPFDTVNANSPEEVNAALDSYTAGQTRIIHFHDVTPLVMEHGKNAGTVAFFNYRDPRDVVVSQMRLHDADLDIAIEMTGRAFSQIRTVLALPRLMLIPYPHLVEHPSAVVYQMAMRMGCLLDLHTVEKIVKETSASKHKKVVENLNKKAPKDALTSFSGKRAVQMDPTYLLNDRHIQSGKSGRWRKELTPDQQARVSNAFSDILETFGFDDQKL